MLTVPAASCSGTVAGTGGDDATIGGGRGGGIVGGGSRGGRGGGFIPRPAVCAGWADAGGSARPRPKLAGLKFTNCHSAAASLVQPPAVSPLTIFRGGESPASRLRAYFRRLILVLKLDIRKLGSDVNHIGAPFHLRFTCFADTTYKHTRCWHAVEALTPVETAPSWIRLYTHVNIPCCCYQILRTRCLTKLGITRLPVDYYELLPIL